MIDGYTVEGNSNRVVVRGSLPINDLTALTKVWKKRGLNAMAFGVASALGATMAVCKQADIEQWEKEVANSAAQQANGDAELEWLLGPDTGISSKSIFSVLASTDVLRVSAKAQLGSFGADVPHDPSDFGRCYRLLEKFPAWRERLNEVAAAIPKYGPMVREWAQMEALWSEESRSRKAPKLYELMRALEDEGTN
jgi:hypothetical protein